MNEIKLSLYVMEQSEQLNIDGIDFESAAFVKVDFQSTANEAESDLISSLIVFSELLKSADGDGKYLIFTSASGVADDGGWSGVNVRHQGASIAWEFWAQENKYRLEFNTDSYLNQIKEMNLSISLLPQ
jgi:hypothetical protein